MSEEARADVCTENQYTCICKYDKVTTVQQQMITAGKLLDNQIKISV